MITKLGYNHNNVLILIMNKIKWKDKILVMNQKILKWFRSWYFKGAVHAFQYMTQSPWFHICLLKGDMKQLIFEEMIYDFSFSNDHS